MREASMRRKMERKEQNEDDFLGEETLEARRRVMQEETYRQDKAVEFEQQQRAMLQAQREADAQRNSNKTILDQMGSMDLTFGLSGVVTKAFAQTNGFEADGNIVSTLPQADRDFVIKGEPGLNPTEARESGEWYGVNGYFRWLESKAYKMHIRVLLSRYRSYQPCPVCHGGRFQPETLNYRIDGLTLPSVSALPLKRLLPLLQNMKKMHQKLKMLIHYHQEMLEQKLQ
jgi:excinuclease UvrABC ATPase subunit